MSKITDEQKLKEIEDTFKWAVEEKLTVRITDKDIEWLIEQVKLFHKAGDKHFLIKSNIELNKEIEELERKLKNEQG